MIAIYKKDAFYLFQVSWNSRQPLSGIPQQYADQWPSFDGFPGKYQRKSSYLKNFLTYTHSITTTQENKIGYKNEDNSKKTFVFKR